MNIDNCDDDSLIELFNHLPFDELFKCRGVNQRWKSLVEMMLSKRKSLSLVRESRNFVPRWHSPDDYTTPKRDYVYICTRKRINTFNHQHLGAMLNKCSQLLSLDLIFMPFNPHLMAEIVREAPQIQSLDLSFSIHLSDKILEAMGQLRHLTKLVVIKCGLNDNHLNTIVRHCPRLQHLDVSNNLIEKGQALAVLNRPMRCLVLENCFKLTSTAILNLSRGVSNAKLTDLRIWMSSVSITTNALEWLVKCLPNQLRHFRCAYHFYGNNFSLSILDKFDQLEVLVINELNHSRADDAFSLDDQGMMKLMRACPNLKRLELQSTTNGGVTDQSLGYLHKFWPKLERLSFQNYYGIKNETLFSISKLANLWYLRLMNAEVDDNGITAVLYRCQQLRHFEIEFSLVPKVPVFPYSDRITKTIILTSIEVAERRPDHRLVFKVFGVCLPPINNWCPPDNLILEVKSRKPVEERCIYNYC